jgi:hypothetical protein
LVVISASLILIFSSNLKTTPQEEDFLYLADILKRETRGIDDDVTKLKVMTDWLHENVKHGEYPPNFNGNGVANVIRGGMGNCGFQSCNISAFAELLGYKEHRLIHNREEWGAPGMHTFAEINMNGNWILFDPDWWQYIENNNGELVGIREAIQDTSQINKPEAAQFIYNTFKDKGYKITPSWQTTPMPYGENGYLNYEKWGSLFVLFKKLEPNIKLITFLSLFLTTLSTVIYLWFKK